MRASGSDRRKVESVAPREAAEQLAIPPSTLRLYAVKFARLLSRDAQTQADGSRAERRHRRYTAGDLQLLATAKALLAGGLTYRLALAELERGAPGGPSAVAAPVTMVARVRERSRPVRSGSRDAGPSVRRPAAPASAAEPGSPSDDAEFREAVRLVVDRLDRVEEQFHQHRREIARLAELAELILAREHEVLARLTAQLTPEPAQRSGLFGLFRRGS